MSGAVSPPEIERQPLQAPEKPKIDPDLLRRVNEALNPLEALLRKPKVRQILEKEPAEEASRKIVERLHKDEAKKVLRKTARRYAMRGRRENDRR